MDNVIDFPVKDAPPEPEPFDLSDADMEKIFEMSKGFTAFVSPSPKYAIGNLFGAVHAAQLNGITEDEFVAKTRTLWAFIAGRV